MPHLKQADGWQAHATMELEGRPQQTALNVSRYRSTLPSRKTAKWIRWVMNRRLQCFRFTVMFDRLVSWIFHEGNAALKCMLIPRTHLWILTNADIFLYKSCTETMQCRPIERNFSCSSLRFSVSQWYDMPLTHPCLYAWLIEMLEVKQLTLS